MIKVDPEQLNWQKCDGLIPAVVQDELTNGVLMLGYMTQQALRRTMNSGYVTFYSRGRDALWMKGEASGNYLIVKSITPDCDQDSLLVKAKPQGKVCHQGTVTCFGDVSTFLGQLEDCIQQRAQKPSSNSYTAQLLAEGIDRAAQKTGEEAVETVIAALKKEQSELCQETADLLFHMLVLLHCRSLSIHDAFAILDERRKV